MPVLRQVSRWAASAALCLAGFCFDQDGISQHPQTRHVPPRAGANISLSNPRKAKNLDIVQQN